MSNETLIIIIIALVAAHYTSIIWEIRKVKEDIDSLRRDVSASALAAANAATTAAQVAQQLINKK